MRHRTIQNMLLLFREGRLEAERHRQVAEHIEQCAPCRVLAERLGRIYGAPATDRAVTAPAALYPRVRARWQSQPAGIPAPAHIRSAWSTALMPLGPGRSLAAAVLLLAAIGAGLILGALPNEAPAVVDQNQPWKEVFYTDMLQADNTHSYYQVVEDLYKPAAAEEK